MSQDHAEDFAKAPEYRVDGPKPDAEGAEAGARAPRLAAQAANPMGMNIGRSRPGARSCFSPWRRSRSLTLEFPAVGMTTRNSNNGPTSRRFQPSRLSRRRRAEGRAKSSCPATSRPLSAPPFMGKRAAMSKNGARTSAPKFVRARCWPSWTRPNSTSASLSRKANSRRPRRTSDWRK